MQIAILEDDPEQREQLTHWIRADGDSVRSFSSGREFLTAVRRDVYDLLIIDWIVPDLSGLEALTRLRSASREMVPVIFLTQRDAEDDIVEALKAGADDYIVKPANRAVLRARMKALLRRAYPEIDAQALSSPPYAIDAREEALSIAGEPVSLTAKEFRLALEFFRHPGRLLTRERLYETVWRKGDPATYQTIDTHVGTMRRKLRFGPDTGHRLVSVYGAGYRLERLES